MVIKLKNDEQIKLEWNFLVIEYLEEYQGGLKQLTKDFKSDNMQIKVLNHFIYSLIAANYEETLTYKQTLLLFRLSDVNKIVDFINDNMSELEDLKKKRTNSTNRQHKKK